LLEKVDWWKWDFAFVLPAEVKKSKQIIVSIAMMIVCVMPDYGFVDGTRPVRVGFARLQ
jgi:hypothetical protein